VEKFCENNFCGIIKDMKRTKTRRGAYSRKRSDTRIGTIEKKYGVDLGVRRDMKLGNYLKKKGYNSLADMLKK